MNRGKHSPKRRSRWNKSAAMMVSLLLVFTMALGGTLAYIFTGTEDVQNTFTISKVTTAVEETIKDGAKTDVKIQNTGDTDAYIRATVVVSWQNDKGEVYGQKPVEGEDYIITLPADSKWKPVTTADGVVVYYYTEKVAKETSTGTLITSIAPVTGKAPDGYGLAVEIIGSGIQADGVKNGVPAVTDAWNVDVNSDGTLDIQ